jgi:hypothetical protein
VSTRKYWGNAWWWIDEPPDGGLMRGSEREYTIGIRLAQRDTYEKPAEKTATQGVARGSPQPLTAG